MPSGTSVNPPLPQVGSDQVHFRGTQVDVSNILSDVIKHVCLGVLILLWQFALRRFVTYLVTIEAFLLKLMFLGNSSLRSQLGPLA